VCVCMEEGECVGVCICVYAWRSEGECVGVCICVYMCVCMEIRG